MTDRMKLLELAARLLRNHVAGENVDEPMHYWADEWDALPAGSAEADTVSRAEHEAALKELTVALVEAEKGEEAAQARVAELEAVARRLVDAFAASITRGAPLSLPRDSWPAIKAAEALLAASPPSAVEDWSKVEQGPFSGPEYSLASKPAASIEAGRVQTSLFRQVAEASVQPAPGEAERCWSCGKEHPAGYKRCGRCNETPEEPDPTPADQPAEQWDMPGAIVRSGEPARQWDSQRGPAGQPRPDDAPPEAQPVRVYLSNDGRTLSLGGRFTTVRACRHCGGLITGGPTACVHCVEKMPYEKRQR